MDYRYLQRLADEDAPARIAKEHQHCAFCGYDLFGGTSDRCPECGNVVDPQAMRDQSQETKAQRIEFEEAVRHVHLAWKLVAMGMALFLIRVPPILGPGTYWLARALGFLCGFVALFLRLAVIRLAKVAPGPVAEAQQASPDPFLAAIEIVGGLFLMGTSIGLK